MICLLSLIVFSFLGIFSAKYRELAAEAFLCVSDRVRREPCSTNLDDRVKATVISKIMDKSPRTAKFVNKHFAKISWLFVILLIASATLAINGTVNYLLYGNCNGPGATGGCTIDKLANAAS